MYWRAQVEEPAKAGEASLVTAQVVDGVCQGCGARVLDATCPWCRAFPTKQAKLGADRHGASPAVHGVCGGVLFAVVFALVMAVFDVAPRPGFPFVSVLLFGLMWGGLPAFVVGFVAGVLYNKHRR